MSKKNKRASKATMEAIRGLLREHQKIRAVGIYMRQVGCSLAEAKHAVDAEESALGLKNQTIPDDELTKLSEKVHAERFPDLGLHRNEGPCLMEEWSVSHMNNSPVFEQCKEKYFANCVVKYVRSDFVVLDIQLKDREWFKSLTEDNQQCLLVSLMVQLGLSDSTVFCSEDATGTTWEFPPV